MKGLCEIKAGAALCGRGSALIVILGTRHRSPGTHACICTCCGSCQLCHSLPPSLTWALGHLHLVPPTPLTLHTATHTQPPHSQTAEYLLEHGLLDLVVPRSFLKGALYEILGFYNGATYKQRGAIPFGVQHGTFLTTEEKVRRKWRSWGVDGDAAADANGDSNGHASGQMALASSSGAGVSYGELVASFESLVGSSPGGSDIADLANDEQALAVAMSLAKNSKIEWVEAARPAEDKQFAFRVSPC